jgi:predicted kinase/SAM-dependent methyltransferase
VAPAVAALPLARLRAEAVLAELRAAGATRVVDLGAGTGALLPALLADPRFTEIVAVDVSARALAGAARKLHLDRMPERQRARLTLLQGALTYTDARLAGFDAAVLMEVVEHVDPRPAARPGARGLRGGRAGDGRGHHPERRAQRALPRADRLPAPRPPVRVDPGRVRGVDGRGRRPVRLHGPYRPGRGRRPRGRPADAAGGVQRERSEPSEAGPPGGRAGYTVTSLAIPDLALVVLVGASGSGKSTFARRHFRPTQVLSSDFCRGLVADDENDQAATPAAFEVLHHIAGVRLRAGRLTVVDATNVRREDRASLVELARSHDVLPVAIVLDLPEQVCLARNADRPDRDLAAAVVRRQRADLRRSLRGLGREGFRKVHVLDSVEAVEQATVDYEKQYNDRRDDPGPFDVIGDVHGCLTELTELLATLGYAVSRDPAGRPVDAAHPDGRRALFLGDLVDRGPGLPRRAPAGDGHGRRRARARRARQPREQAGPRPCGARRDGQPTAWSGTLAQLEEERRSSAGRSPDSLLRPGQPLRPGRRPAGRRARPGWRAAAGPVQRPGPGLRPVRRHHGETTSSACRCATRGRRSTAAGPPGCTGTRPSGAGMGQQHALPGHRLRVRRPADRAALPGAELVSVPAHDLYEPARPLAAPTPTRPAGVLDVDDVLGKRVVETRCRAGHRTGGERGGGHRVMEPLRHRPGAAALPAADDEPAGHLLPAGLLEHPAEALAHYRDEGVERLVCQGEALWLPGGGAGPALGGGAVHTRTGARLLRSRPRPRRCSAGSPRRRSRRGCSRSWTPTGCCWTRRSCRGRRRRPT